jgi:hypothetical protein
VRLAAAGAGCVKPVRRAVCLGIIVIKTVLFAVGLFMLLEKEPSYHFFGGQRVREACDSRVEPVKFTA